MAELITAFKSKWTVLLLSNFLPWSLLLVSLIDLTFLGVLSISL